MNSIRCKSEKRPIGSSSIGNDKELPASRSSVSEQPATTKHTVIDNSVRHDTKHTNERATKHDKQQQDANERRKNPNNLPSKPSTITIERVVIAKIDRLSTTPLQQKAATTAAAADNTESSLSNQLHPTAIELDRGAIRRGRNGPLEQLKHQLVVILLVVAKQPV